MTKISNLDVYEFLQKIPKGKVITYGMIGEYFGNKYYARAIGNILHQNPDGVLYPCYKVVNAQGKLTENYVFGGIEKQKELLENDGIEVINYTVDLKRYKFIP